MRFRRTHASALTQLEQSNIRTAIYSCLNAHSFLYSSMWYRHIIRSTAVAAALYTAVYHIAAVAAPVEFVSHQSPTTTAGMLMMSVTYWGDVSPVFFYFFCLSASLHVYKLPPLEYETCVRVSYSINTLATCHYWLWKRHRPRPYGIFYEYYICVRDC